jgi:hypothetical protein
MFEVIVQLDMVAVPLPSAPRAPPLSNAEFEDIKQLETETLERVDT